MRMSITLRGITSCKCHQILMSTLKSPQARQFVETHTDQLIELCMYPEVAQLLRAAKGQ